MIGRRAFCRLPTAGKRKNEITCVFIFLLLCLSCSTLPHRSSPSLSLNEARRKTHALPKSPEDSEIRRKLTRFRRILGRGKPISNEGWRLHDELLKAYVALKSEPHGFMVIIPAKTRMDLSFRTFCLDPHKVAPDRKEHYRWVRRPPEIPYFHEVLQYWSHHTEVPQSDVQTLIWNLKIGTYFEDYPESLRGILIAIDPSAPIKLPSKTKSEVGSVLSDLLQSVVPETGVARDTLDWSRDQFQKYADIAGNVSKLSSRFRPISVGQGESVEGTPLFADTTADGFQAHQATIYNPGPEDRLIDLSDYYLQPDRSDVQPIGIVPEATGHDPGLTGDLEKALYDDMARVGVGFTPGLNDIADTYELFTGKDFVSGRNLTLGERALSGAGLLLGGANLRWAERVLAAPERALPRFEEGLSEAAGRPNARIGRDLRDLYNEAETTADGIRSSPTLRRLAESPEFRRTDFHVKSDGEVIPAKGYRYVRSEAPYLSDFLHSGEIPADSKGTYVSFDKFDDPGLARARLQVPHDARYRAEFDTDQIIDDIQIPRGKWGDADYLEPITRDNPIFGEGGATQAISRQPIKVQKIIDLKTGKVVYGS